MPAESGAPLFKVTTHDIEELEQLPRKQNHSGRFKLIGQKNDGLPTCLYDNRANRTIIYPSPDQLQNYIAVSWTWGRYQPEDENERKRRTRGTPWRVPVVDRDSRKRDILHHLKRALRKIRNYRYFWVDVLCIDQTECENNTHKEREIMKQATIFGQAKGVIAFLWTIDERLILTNALYSFSNLVAWSLRFGRNEQHIVHETNRSPKSIVPTDFERLRGDNWFTSLWALQEIVLFPEAIWMTRDGGFCKLNGKPMTTRLLAIAIRVLSWMAQRRELQWLDTERCYVTWCDMREDVFTRLKEDYASEAHQLREAARKASVKQRYQAMDSRPGQLVIENKSLIDRPPWIITCRNREQVFKDQIQQWTDWGFGTACTDISISASRTTILLAAHNRDVVHGQSREQALAAALKIQIHPKLSSSWANVASRRHFSTDLLNLVLREDGLQIFNVAHASPQPSAIRRDASLSDHTEWLEVDDEIEYISISQEPKSQWDMVEVKTDKFKVELEYSQRSYKHHVEMLSGPSRSLTSMSPCTASRINPQVSHFAEHDTYEWEPSNMWHMHEGGVLHIPYHAQIQLIEKRDNGTALWFRANGLSTDYEIRTLSDLKLVLRTQLWLKDTLGSKPRFLFVMLGIHSIKSVQRPRTTTESFVEKPEVIGVVLVGHESLELSTPLTRWHKFGTYRGWGPRGSLAYKDGLLVSSHMDSKSAKHQTLAECRELQQRVEDIAAALSQHADPLLDGYDIIMRSDVIPRTNTP